MDFDFLHICRARGNDYEDFGKRSAGAEDRAAGCFILDKESTAFILNMAIFEIRLYFP